MKSKLFINTNEILSKIRFDEIVERVLKSEGLEKKVSTTNVQKSVSRKKSVSKIVVDGSVKGSDRYTISVNGVNAFLRGKSFHYFSVLAFACMNGRDWVKKEELEPGLSQAKYVYRLREELYYFLGDSAPVIENDKNGCYKLAVSPKAIKFNMNNLKDHDDLELRKILGLPV